MVDTYEKSTHRMSCDYVSKTENVEEPKFYCATCTKLESGKYCACYKRRVEADYNRCFNHSAYNPALFNFKTPENIEEIIKEEEAVA